MHEEGGPSEAGRITPAGSGTLKPCSAAALTGGQASSAAKFPGNSAARDDQRTSSSRAG